MKPMNDEQTSTDHSEVGVRNAVGTRVRNCPGQAPLTQILREEAAPAHPEPISMSEEVVVDAYPTPKKKKNGGGVSIHNSQNRKTLSGGGPGLILTPRDREILAICSDQKFLTLKQIGKIYGKAGTKRVARRVHALCQAGYLSALRLPELGMTKIYLPSRKTLATLRVTLGHLQPVSRITTAQVMHDLIVTDCRFELEARWQAQFVSEARLKTTDATLIPDGIMLFRSGKGVILEVENSLKKKARLLSNLERLSHTLDPRVCLILYVATTPGIFSTLKAAIQACAQHLKSVQIGLMMFDDFKSPDPEVWTPHGTLNIFEKKEW